LGLATTRLVGSGGIDNFIFLKYNIFIIDQNPQTKRKMFTAIKNEQLNSLNNKKAGIVYLVNILSLPTAKQPIKKISWW
jgi:hypothetical protein